VAVQHVLVMMNYYKMGLYDSLTKFCFLLKWLI